MEAPLAQDEAARTARRLGVDRERKHALEMDIALNAETERHADRFQLVQREAAEFPRATAKVRKTKQNAIFVDLGCKPGRLEGKRALGIARDGLRARTVVPGTGYGACYV